MVHAKNFGAKSFKGKTNSALERSLLFLTLLTLLAPARVDAQVTEKVQLSSSFLESRLLLESYQPGASSTITSNGSALQNPAAPLYDVIALRVSFQPDTSRFTTGDGTFDGVLFENTQTNPSLAPLEASVDPLPHDAGYFDAHLQFLANYVRRVSDGKTQINTHLIPETIQVSREMAAYSPIGFEANSDEEIVKLARFVEEAWTLADQQSSFDMSSFDPATTALIIFHAGIGRDIELVGTSLDKTPQDLPTIFFNQQALDRLLPASQISFNGFPVNHTILMPRTETRQGFDFIGDQPFLVEFSINGLLAASFFNYLGVPDLFDTSSGESAIGPFGLMDPLGLFAYNGLFPPEPAAWTKLYLGWADLIEVDPASDQLISLEATGLPAENQMARVPVSSSEYFLVENRNRDVEMDGLTLTIYRNGNTFTQQVQNGEENFNAVDISGFEGGVVVDVDNFDWALPGGIDEDGNTLEGGILIWHIDERLLAEGLPANQVNTNPVQRAVDLEEADGAQDLGFPTDNIFGPQSFLGSPFDFYYEGNPVVVITGAGEERRLYQNSFGPATYPNSNSNAGGPSFVVLDNFSLPGPSMSFNYRRGEVVGVTPVEGFPSAEPADVPEGSFVASFQNPDSGVIYPRSSGEIVVSTRLAAEPVIVGSSVVKSLVVLPDGRLAALGASDQGEAQLLLLQNGVTANIPLGVGAENLLSDYNHLLYDIQGNRLIALIDGAALNTVLAIDLDQNTEFQLSTIQSTRLPLFSIALTKQGEVAVLGTEGVTVGCCDLQWAHKLPVNEQIGQLVLGEDASGRVGAFTYTSKEILIFLQADGTTSVFDLTRFEPADASYLLNRYPILVELNSDNYLEVLLSYGPNLMAFSAGGGMVENFPIPMPATATTQPLVVSLQSAEGPTFVTGASDGYIYAFQPAQQNRQASGFPLGVGAGITATPLFKDGALYSIDQTGVLKAWEIDGLDEVWWGGQFGNQYNTSFVELEPEGESGFSGADNNLLVSGENYNWPNPIREGKTFFRLAPRQDVRVTITIVDAAGGLVDKLVVENVRGDTSTDLPWQTEAPSGLYYARVEAVATDGTSETTLIKMAIVR